MGFTFDGDVLNGETEDDSPDHSKGHFRIPINNFCQSKNNKLVEQLKISLADVLVHY